MDDASTEFSDSEEDFDAAADDEMTEDLPEEEAVIRNITDQSTGESTPGTQLELLPERSENTLPDFNAGRLIDSLIDEDEFPLITAPWPDENCTTQHEADMRKTLSEHLELPQDSNATHSWASARAIVAAGIAESTTPRCNFTEISSTFAPLTPRDPEPSEVSADSLVESEETKTAVIKNVLDSAFSRSEEPLSARDIVESGSWLGDNTALIRNLEDDFDEIDEQELLAELDSNLGFFDASRKIAAATAVPAAFCFLLWMFGSYLVQTPQIADTLLTLTMQELPAPAPKGVQIADLKPNYVALDDGREVVEITGSLVNQTSSKFGSVKIEASLYDDKNRPIDRVIIFADNSLSSVSRLESLGRDDINSLQAKRQSEKFLLDAHQKAPFRVVFTDNGQQAAWFSTNIYSVTTPDAA